MDVIAHVDSLPASIHEPGGCLPIDGPGMEELLSSLPAQSTRRSPGGSASNVARGVAELLSRLASGHGPSAGSPPSEDIRVQFIGMVGDDETAAEYEAALARDVLGGRSVADVAIVPQWMTKIDGRTSRGS